MKRTPTEGQRYHLVGVAGAGMSALARLLHQDGARVSGSDATNGKMLRALRSEGISVWSGHDPERISGHGGIVVRSAAVPLSDPEVGECRRRKFVALLYSEVIGKLSNYNMTLAISGTHGKTTTTALTVAGLRGSGMDPSHLIGGPSPRLGGNGHAGRDRILIVEACEYRRSFHQLIPKFASVLNIDPDHFDCYASRKELDQAFGLFLARVPRGGMVFVHEGIGDSVLQGLAGGVQLVRVGEGLFAGLRPVDVRVELGRYEFIPMMSGERLPRVRLQVPGRFQMHNALFALAMAISAGGEPEDVCDGISEFEGVQRRFQLMTGKKGGRLISDYAHHPVEIRAVIGTARRRFPRARLLVVFQPHQHQRTRVLFEDFAASLAQADYCLVSDIYGARETAEIKATVSAADLVKAVEQAGGNCECAGSLDQIAPRLRGIHEKDDVTLILGAGDIDEVVEDVLATL